MVENNKFPNLKIFKSKNKIPSTGTAITRLYKISASILDSLKILNALQVEKLV
jgi:hypothetical protein